MRHSRVTTPPREAGTRRTARRKNRRRPDYLQLARQVAALFVAAELLHAAFASPRLAIREVQISGARRVSTDRISKLAAVPEGRNIFHVNLASVRDRVLREPMVRDALVSRALPGTIRIAVTERVPMLVIRSNVKSWEVDETGVAFRERSDAAEALQTPTLDVSPGDVPPVGGRLPGERFQAALACLRLTAKDQLPLRKMSFDDGGELWLNVAVPGNDGERLLPVRLGRPEDLDAKISQLALVLPAATADGEYLDLMCAARAAYRKQGTPHRDPPASAAGAGTAAPDRPVVAPSAAGSSLGASIGETRPSSDTTGPSGTGPDVDPGHRGSEVETPVQPPTVAGKPDATIR